MSQSFDNAERMLLCYEEGFWNWKDISVICNVALGTNLYQYYVIPTLYCKYAEGGKPKNFTDVI